MLRRFKLKYSRTLIVLGVFFGLAGLVNLFAPLDLMAAGISAKIRSQPASGDIVIVSLDHSEVEDLSVWPWPQDEIASTIQLLLNAGANKVVLSHEVPMLNGELEEPLASVLVEHPNSVFLVEPAKEPGTEEEGRSMGGVQYASSATPIHAVKHLRYWGGVERDYYALEGNGRVLFSAASVLTGEFGEFHDFFPIDYSIQARTIPYISFAMLQRYPTRLSEISGKDVIVGFEVTPRTAMMKFLGQGNFGPATLIAMSAETLKNGRPMVLPWYVGWIVGVIIAYFVLQKSSARVQFVICLAAMSGLVFTVVGLNSIGVFFSVFHLVGLMLVSTVVGMSRNLREKIRGENSVNPISGLPSVTALRLMAPRDGTLVHLKVRRFSELLEVLSEQDQKDLAEKVANLVNPGADVWHSDNGRFYWISESLSPLSADEHFAGLSRIFRNGFSLGKLSISLDVVFGTDQRQDVSMSERVKGATTSAKKAIMKGVQWESYKVTNRSEATWSVTLLRELDMAIDRGDIQSYLQPKLDLRTGQICGAEALARWAHPTRGMIFPDNFVAQAEQGGRLLELTLAVLRSALASCRHAIMADPDFILSVNIAPSMLENSDLPKLLSSSLSEYNMQPTSVMLEVTESSRFANDDVCSTTMQALRDTGFELSIDDYGTANSTLEYLRKIPASELKIDRKFVANMLSNEADHHLISSTIQLAHRLRMLVVAEGVEDRETLRALSALNCDLIQGYVISKPLDSAAFELFVSQYSLRKHTLNAS